MPHIICDLEEYRGIGDVATIPLIPIVNLVDDGELMLSIWGYNNEEVIIDFKDSERHEITITNFGIKSANDARIKFQAHKFPVRIQNMLLLNCSPIELAKCLNINITNLSIIAPKLELGSLSVKGSIEISISPDEDDLAISNLMRGVNIIPGSGEAVYGESSINSLVQLKQNFPNMQWLAPVVSWFGDSLNIATCHIKPAVESRDYGLQSWKVGQYNRASAMLISRDPEEPETVRYGGSPNDIEVLAYLGSCRDFGFKIMFYPLIMMDVDKKPWRGHMTGNSDAVERFYREEYEPFILHYANLTKGKVDAFLIGSELIGLTKIHDASHNFPFVKKLVELATKVKNIVGRETRVSYAADWSEYHHTDGGWYNLDELWGSPSIDFIGIDAYFPLTHSKFSSIDPEDIKLGWRSGEGWDHYYEDSNIKDIRHPIDSPWAWKNIEWFWSNTHKNPDGSQTSWQPLSKKIWFTEFGFPSIDKASNKPNVFFDPKSLDGGVPTYSNGKPDDRIQKVSLRATLEHWQNSPMLEEMFYWCFDARGIGWQKLMDQGDEKPYYADHALWRYGHWLDGKINPENTVTLKGEFKSTSLIVKSPVILISEATFAIQDISWRGDICQLSGDIKILSKTLFINIKENMTYFDKVTSRATTEHQGSKFTITRTTEAASKIFITTDELVWAVKGLLGLSSTQIDSKKIKFRLGAADFNAAITTDTIMEEFLGKEDWKGDRRESRNTKVRQYAHPVIIYNAESVDIGVIGEFKAAGTKVYTNAIKTHAADYKFTGVPLQNSEIRYAEEKGGFFTPGKETNSSSIDSAVDGVLIVASGKGYMIADGKIWLAASIVQARDLVVVAKKIELIALIGSHYEDLQISAFKAGLAFSAGETGVFAGAEIRATEHNETHYSEYAIPSMLIGTSLLTARADELRMISSIIAGEVGDIEVNIWEAQALRLRELHRVTDQTISMRAGFGIQQNITPALRSIAGTADAASEIGSNDLAPLNVASGAYASFRAVTNMMSAPVSAGLTIGLDVSFSGSSYSRASFEASRAQFGYLRAKVAGDIRGSLEIAAATQDIDAANINLFTPEDEVHRSSYAVSAGISNHGAHIFAMGEEDGARFGGGVSNSFGESNFGPEFRLVFGQGRNQADITYAHPNTERVSQVWSNASIGNMVESARHELRRGFNEVRERISDVIQYGTDILENIIGSDELPPLIEASQELAYEAKEDSVVDGTANEWVNPDEVFGERVPTSGVQDRQAIINSMVEQTKYEIYVEKLTEVANDLSGLEKEFALEAIGEYKAMHQRSIAPNQNFEEVLRGVVIRNLSGETPGLRFLLDLSGSFLEYAFHQASIIVDENCHIIRVTAGAESNMLLSRVSSVFQAADKVSRSAFGDEGVNNAYDAVKSGINVISRTNKALDERLSRGEIVLKNGFISVATAEIGSGLVSKIKIPNKTYAPASAAAAVEFESEVIASNIKNTTFALDEHTIHAKIDSITGTSPIVYGSQRELAALEMQLVAQESGTVIAGAGHAKPIKDIARIIQTYGGNDMQWVKVTGNELNVRGIFVGGESRQLHWYQNLETGAIIEVKVKAQ